MASSEILIRLSLSLIFSGLIGYEREVSESNAGLKTHILVGIGSTIVSLMQLQLVNEVLKMSQSMHANNPAIAGVIRTDIGRVVAQVVSGIGFLGAGTIIVTKRKISGLTTAASIWTVAIIGLTLGFGFYRIAIFGFVFVISTLFFFKRVIQIHAPERLVIKYLGGDKTLGKIMDVFHDMTLDVEPVRYSTETFGDMLISTHVFKINSRNFVFEDFVDKMSHTENIVSVERTNIEG